MHRYLVPLLALFASQILALSTISAKGSKLFTSDGKQFFIKGIAYQLTIDDPLANPDQCKLDAALMQTLNANSIRVYHVQADLDHDSCMSTFADAGIYAWIDLDTFNTYIIPQGEQTPEWNQTMMNAYGKVIDTFQKYDNTGGFFVGNEMLTTGSSSIAAPYIKAAARDMKAYRDNKGYRDIPIGYSAADIPDLRPNLQNYLACGNDPAENVDFYSLNVYEWCGQSSYDVSGYDILQQNASAYNIPIFISETGCNTPAPRTFDDQAAILGSDMDGTWSGAIIYEWIEEANDYGLISYGAPAGTAAAGTNVVAGYTRAGTPTPVSPDFDNLKSHWATLSPTGVSLNAYSPSLTPPACPSYTSNFWEVSGNAALPTLGEKGVGYTTLTHSGAGAGATSTSSKTSTSGATSATRSASSGPSKRSLTSFLHGTSVWKYAVLAVMTVGGLALVV